MGWALPLVIFAIIFIVMAHEFGHFITAKRAGLRVTDFFVGFGPVLWSTTIGETRYGVRAILAGGYVKVPGMTWTEEIPVDEESRTYRAASYPKKVQFASAGSLMHLFMALLLAWAAITFVGLPSTSHVGVGDFTKWQGHAQNAAQLAGMKVGDQIVSINSVAITSDNQLINVVSHETGKNLTIVVKRAGRDLTLHATPVNGVTVMVNGKRLADHGYLGVGIEGSTRSELLVRGHSRFVHRDRIALGSPPRTRSCTCSHRASSRVSFIRSPHRPRPRIRRTN